VFKGATRQARPNGRFVFTRCQCAAETSLAHVHSDPLSFAPTNRFWLTRHGFDILISAQRAWMRRPFQEVEMAVDVMGLLEPRLTGCLPPELKKWGPLRQAQCRRMSLWHTFSSLVLSNVGAAGGRSSVSRYKDDSRICWRRHQLCVRTCFRRFLHHTNGTTTGRWSLRIP